MPAAVVQVPTLNIVEMRGLAELIVVGALLHSLVEAGHMGLAVVARVEQLHLVGLDVAGHMVLLGEVVVCGQVWAATVPQNFVGRVRIAAVVVGMVDWAFLVLV